MKGFSIFLLIVAFFAAVYFGLISLVGKTMKDQPTADVSETTSAWQTESQKNRDLQQQQRDLVEQRKERMRDLGHR